MPLLKVLEIFCRGVFDKLTLEVTFELLQWENFLYAIFSFKMLSKHAQKKNWGKKEENFCLFMFVYQTLLGSAGRLMRL